MRRFLQHHKVPAAALLLLLLACVLAAPSMAVHYDGYFTNLLAKGRADVTGGLTVGGDAAFSGNAAGDGTGTLSGFLGTVEASAVSITLTAADTGTLFSNSGAGALSEVTFTLPAAAPGYQCCHANAAGVTLNVDTASGDQILGLTNAAGDKIQSVSAGDMACAIALDVTNWVMVTRGTWSDAD
jgi:hypothetical protein